MADWGLYTALRGVDDWQQKRQDRALSMSIAKERNAIAQQKVAEQTAFEGKLIEYFNQLENMDVMPEDAERIQQLAKKEQSNVVNQIAKYNGDLKRFMTSGGLTVLNSYKNNIMKSEEVNTALQNKANLTSFVTAMKDDKFIFPVTVNIPTGETDENGNPTYKQEKTTFEKALALKKQGIINELPSVSFEDKIDVNSLDFHKTFKNNADPYSVQVVTQNDLINRLKEQGASEEQATFRALEYGDRVNKGGSPMYWNRKDPYEKWLEEQKLNLQKQKLMSGGDGSGGGARITNAESNQILTLGVGQSAPLTPEAQKFWLTGLGADLNPKTGLWKINSTLKAFDADDSSVSYELNQADYFKPERYVVDKDAQGNVRYYIDGTAQYEAGKSEGPYDETFGLNSIRSQSIKNNWKDLGDDRYSGRVRVDITEQMANEVFRQSLDKTLGLKDEKAFTDPATYSSREQRLNSYRQEVQQLMMAFPDLSPQQIQEYLFQYQQKMTQ